MFRLRGSIRNKLILFMLIATIIPIVTSIIVTYSYNIESVKKKALKENSNLLFQGKTNLTHYFSIIDQATLAAYSDYRVFNILQGGYQENNSDQKSDLIRSVQLISRSAAEVVQVHLNLARSSEHFLYTYERFFSYPKGDASAEPKPVFAGYQSYMEPTHPSHDYGVNYFPKSDPLLVFTLHRPVYNVPDTEQLGLLSVDVKLDFIDRVSKQLFDSQNEELYILSENGVVVYSSSQEEWGKTLEQDWVAHVLSQEEEHGTFEWKADGFSGMNIFEKIATPYMNWTLVKQIPYSNLYESARELARINVGVFSLFLIIAIAATVLISIRFTAPLRALISTINKIQAGQLNVEIDVRGKDEIGVLARRFRLMMQTINELILREYALQLANKTNELKALQAQINPHFLNNALQSIGTLALQHQESRIYTLIASLGKMMRYHMNTDKTVVPLQQEIEYVKSYLELQQQRFERRLQVEIQVQPEVQLLLLPKMTLQPIVENFFKHGYDSTQGGRLLLECGLAESEVLRIAVTDNGKGMEQRELAALQEQLEQDPSRLREEAGSIGLYNVIARIKLYFNERARMDISGVEPSGLRVELYIPLNEGEVKSHEGIDRG